MCAFQTKLCVAAAAAPAETATAVGFSMVLVCVRARKDLSPPFVVHLHRYISGQRPRSNPKGLSTDDDDERERNSANTLSSDVHTEET